MISLGAFMVLIGVICLFLGYADPILLLSGLGLLSSAAPILYGAMLNGRAGKPK